MNAFGRYSAWLLGAMVVAAVELVGVSAVTLGTVSSAQAQLFDDRFQFLEERARRQRQRQQLFPDGVTPRQQTTESLRPPAPKKPETPPEATVLVLGDSMAEWLAYGLESAFAETPEIGITRKNRNAGLIRADTRSESFDWPKEARETLAAQKPHYIVVMLGIADRQSLRERQVTKLNPAPAQPSSEPQIVAPEPPANTSYEFRSEKWAELYGKRIDELIGVLKSANVPVLWVGLPTLRGARSTADMQYLNDLYRNHAQKAGLIYVDVWDGFVNESGDFALHGPDFEGQIRRLRASDGVHFTLAGARKLAHYVDRELRRVIQARPIPLALPSTSDDVPGGTPGAAVPGVPTRPLVGPVVPLTAMPGEQEGLLGGAGVRSPNDDPAATRVLIKGEPIQAAAGRADDFAWPRREIAIVSPGSAEAPALARAGEDPSTKPATSPQRPVKKTAARPPSRTPPTAPSWTFGPAARPTLFWPFGR